MNPGFHRLGRKITAEQKMINKKTAGQNWSRNAAIDYPCRLAAIGVLALECGGIRTAM